MKHLLLILIFVSFSAMKGYTAESNFDAAKNTINKSEQGVSEKNNKIVFPCELSDHPKENTKIFFYGANHISKKDRTIREMLTVMGAEGDIYVGLEGDYYDFFDDMNLEITLNKYGLELNTEKSRVFGLEDMFVHTLTILPVNYVFLYRAVNNLFGEEARLPEHKMSFFLNFVTNPFLREIWSQINRPFSYPEDERLALFIDELISLSGSEEKWFSKLSNVQTHSVWTSHYSLLRLSKKMAEDFILLHQSNSQEKMPNLDSYYALLEHPTDLLVETSYANEIPVKWRDPALFNNIVHIYCSALKEKKPLWLVVGRLHVESLSDLLRATSLGRIEIVNYTSERSDIMPDTSPIR